MTVDSTTYAGVLFLSGLASALTSVVVLGRARTHARDVQLAFSAVALAAAVWATAYGLHLLSADLAGKLFWTRVMWLGAAPIATFWFLFVLRYAGHGSLLSRRTVALLAVEPALVLVSVFTSDAHGLFIAETDVAAGPIAALVVSSAPLFAFHTLYTLVIGLVGIVFLSRMLSRVRDVYRRQTSILLVASLVPGFALVGFTFGLGPAPTLDLTPMSFAISAGMVLTALHRYRLFDVTPVARDVVFDEMRDGIVVLNESDEVVEMNPRARALLGVHDADVVGRHVEALPTDDRRFTTLIDGDRDRINVSAPGEEQRFYEVTATPFDGPRSHERGTLLVFRDVTGRRRTEEQFRALIENARDVIVVLDEEGTRTYCSPSISKVLGHDPEELVGENAFELIHPEDRGALREAFEELLEDGSEPRRVEYRILHDDGSWRKFEAVGVSLLDDPAVEGVVVNSRDVTEQRRYEQRLRVLNRVLRHDLRNEMNVIMGNADLLTDENLTAEAQEYAGTIQRKARSLVDLGEQTRKIDHTLHSSDGIEKPLEITEPIGAKLDSIQQEHPSAIIHREYPDEQWVNGDDLLESALMSVIDNAIEHNDRVVPKISVSVDHCTHNDADFVEIEIRDNGPGIPESERKVFVEGTETPLSHGSGLGLWLVKWIITKSNGQLEFEANEPRGTVVCIRLPDAAARPVSESAARTD